MIMETLIQTEYFGFVAIKVNSQSIIAKFHDDIITLFLAGDFDKRFTIRTTVFKSVGEEVQ